jgi:uncharacterized membrane protein
MGEQKYFIFMSIYDDPVHADADMETLRRLHSDGALSAYDAAVAQKDANGDVKVRKREVPTADGAWTGVVAGAVIGILFPPSILAMGAAGAGVGAIVAHFGRGLSRADVKDLGELLDAGQAALVVIASEPIVKPLVDAGIKARKYIQKETTVDPKRLEYHLKAVEKELAASGSD